MGGGEKKKTLDQAEKFGERASGTKAVIRGARLMLMLQSPTELTGGGDAPAGYCRRSEGC